LILRYIYSACIVVETSDVRICCDPWFTQGIYDGAWYQYPEVMDPITKIGPVDFVYVSHIHPDHYDPPFLRVLLEANQGCQLLIGDENQSHLKAKMLRDGLEPVTISRIKVGATEIAIFPNYSDSEINIDSALVIKDPDYVLVNMNDCAFDAQQVTKILEFSGKTPDFACLPYSGAGPYPQAYRFELAADQLIAANQKKQQFFALFERFLVALNAKRAMPFAGLYYLGGSRRWMNSLRGIPDVLEVSKGFGDRVIVLEEADGQLDLRTGEILHARTEPYDPGLRDDFLSRYDSVEYPYKLVTRTSEAVIIPKLRAAHIKACERIDNSPPSWICFKSPGRRFMCVHCDDPGGVTLYDSVESLWPREEIYLDERLLDGLLERRFHWNNAHIGSHFEFSRVPEEFDGRVYNLLNFLYI
jgi:UDP-MurNAc hydroxylase